MNKFLELKEFLNIECEKNNLQILKFTYWKGAKFFQLSIIIEHESFNTNLLHCQEIFSLAKLWLKNENLLETTYLNVASPSIDREMYNINDYTRHINLKISLELKEKNSDNQKKFIGFIKNVKYDVIFLEIEDKIKEFQLEEIKKAKLIPNWDEIKKGIK